MLQESADGMLKMQEKWGAVVPFFGGDLGPHVTQCNLAEAYLHTKWHLDPSNHLATIHQRRSKTGLSDFR